MVPAPVAVPSAGTTTERLSVRTLPALMLILVLRDWMAVADPVFARVRAVTAESLEPRSKPAGGELCLAARRAWMWAATLALWFLPSERALRSTLARPAMPASGEMTPLEARSRWEMAMWVLRGVAEGLAWLMGPAVPSAVSEPP